MEKYEISLKNGRTICLSVAVEGNEYKIAALDTNYGIVVGLCEFSLYNRFNIPFSCEKEKVIYAKYRNISITDVPEQKTIKSPYIDGMSILVNNKNNINHDKAYVFIDKYCELELIQILKEEYFGVGLGRAMYALLEKIVNKLGVTVIEGNYIPTGDFGFESKKFYLRNGFKFITYDFGFPLVTKELLNQNKSIQEKL